MITCLVAGLEKAAYHNVNYDKLNHITQRPNENPAEFLERLTVALQRYTKLDPESAEAKVVLNTHFIAQSAPDIRKRLKKAEDGPQTPQRELVKMAFKVFNNREEKKIAHKRENYEILAAAIRRRGTRRKPPGPCFKCGQEGHWAKACPSPQPPPGPCPRCGQKGHWGVDCPSTRSLPGSKGMVVPRRTSYSS
ncbi:PREDICTED: endogenous retrovirus group K member 113 Gag polyprotein-like isoform X1 [Dipodomys ordii]|uniref:Endogenous retrovirus group K member 113 Gag polyprotein-like isoform X1 n=1 Tax=Dipodomys ordii TaxID=10020 RepID=A0A1S3FCX4_DIPOR|nr:PREDICTED: endogenous retrovirus group K member 113 Gag polyprotein-like isoform X1 [Dipodomys ordii]